MDHVICDFCGEDFPFNPRKPTKKFCNEKCYHSSKNRTVELICEFCNGKFSEPYRFRSKKTCSRECFSSLMKSRSVGLKKNCGACGKEFDVSPKSSETAKYCSYECFLSTRKTRQPNVILKCESCEKEFEVSFKRQRRFCTKSCALTGENNPRYGKPGTLTGKKSWNNGLTSKSDHRLEKIGKKISEIAKEQFMLGLRSNKGDRNPNYGKTPESRTPQQKENYSIAATKRIQTGISGYKTQHITGYYKGQKSTNQIRFKSSWELIAMIWWDKSDDVISYEYEPMTFKLITGKRTIPDFLVHFKNGEKIFFEIKPTAIQNIISERLQIIKETLKNQGLQYKLLGNHDIDNMKKELGLEYVENEINSYRNRL
jgi:hypothetical protein